MNLSLTHREDGSVPEVDKENIMRNALYGLKGFVFNQYGIGVPYCMGGCVVVDGGGVVVDGGGVVVDGGGVVVDGGGVVVDGGGVVVDGGGVVVVWLEHVP